MSEIRIQRAIRERIELINELEQFKDFARQAWLDGLVPGYLHDRAAFLLNEPSLAQGMQTNVQKWREEYLQELSDLGQEMNPEAYEPQTPEEPE